MTLRLRSAEPTVAVGEEEYFGRTPESVLSDRELSPSSKVVYGAVTLWMIKARNRTICLSTMADLGRIAGLEERQTRRCVRELELRGHVIRERVRTVSGSPQGIRPLAILRRSKAPALLDASNRSEMTGADGASNRSDLTGCNRSEMTGEPVTDGRETGLRRPGDRSQTTGPYKREREKSLKWRDAPPAAVVTVGTSPPPAASLKRTEAEEVERNAALDELRSRLGRIGAGGRAHKKAGGQPASEPPGPVDRLSSALDCTTESSQKSSYVERGEHNSR